MIGKINSITNTNKNFSFKSIKVRKDGETFKLMQDYMNNAVYSGKEMTVSPLTGMEWQGYNKSNFI